MPLLQTAMYHHFGYAGVVFTAIALWLFIGGLATYTYVLDLGDIGVGLMTVFNMIALIPMSGQAIPALNEYMAIRKKEKSKKYHYI